MSNTDDASGRIKEAAGDLTNNDDLKREGKVEQAEGAVKEKVDEAADKVKDAVNPFCKHNPESPRERDRHGCVRNATAPKWMVWSFSRRTSMEH
jgi:uncharacterized protein YjbJ (UPF0337 family)